MNKPLVGALVVVSVVVAAGGGYWFGQQRNGPASAGTAAPPTAAKAAGGLPAGIVVEAQKVATISLPQTITAVGSLRSDESVTLRPEVAGRIIQIGFQEGQRITKGALLVRLDPAVPEAEVAQAHANLTLAKSKFDRAVDLAQRNFMSGQAKDEAENNLKVAEASLKLAEAKLAKLDLRAPFSGIIGLRSVSLGDYVKEGADLVNLESIDPLKVDFRVPEIYMRQVEVGQSLQLQLDAMPGRTFEGKVFAVNPLIDAAGRSMVIRAIVRNPDTSLRPGMFTRVRLITRDAKDALVLPEHALVPQGDQQFVFRIVDGKAVRTKVEVGQRRDAKVEVLNGLDKEDVVVTAGQMKLRDGADVVIADVSRKPGAAKAQAAISPTPGGGSGTAKAQAATSPTPGGGSGAAPAPPVETPSSKAESTTPPPQSKS